MTLDGLAREYALLATGIGLAVVIYASAYIPLHLRHHERSDSELPRFFGFLLLFMAALPLAQRGLDTMVPRTTQSAGEAASDSQIVVRYEANGRVSINQQAISIPDLPARLREIYQSRQDKTVYILGDASLRYAAIVQVIDIAKGAGVSRVGIITEGMRGI